MLFVIKATAGLHCHKYPLHRRELPYSYTKYASLWVIWGYIYYGYQTTRPLAAAYMIYHSHAQLCSTLSWSNYPQHYVSVFSFYLHVTRLCVLLFSIEVLRGPAFIFVIVYVWRHTRKWPPNPGKKTPEYGFVPPTCVKTPEYLDPGIHVMGECVCVCVRVHSMSRKHPQQTSAPLWTV